jgi:hypothetical protein
MDKRMSGLRTPQMKRSVRTLISLLWIPGAYFFSEDQLREKSRKWLSPPDPSTNHNIARKAHHKGTASWFFEGGIFEQWKSSPSLLWVHGKRMFPFFSIHMSLKPNFVAGSGKSVLWFVIFLLLSPGSTQIIVQLWDN